MDLTNKLSDNLKDCINDAKKQAKKHKVPHITVNFFLIALFSQEGSLAYDILSKKKIAKADLEKILLGTKTPPTEGVTSVIGMSKNLQALLMKSFVLAQKHKHYFVGTEHCLSVLLDQPPHTLNHVFELYKIDKKKLKTQIDALLRGNSKFPELTRFFSGTEGLESFGDELPPELTPPNSIESFATDITDAKFQEGVNPVIKREREIERMIQILCRKDKNNPVILGDPGVGKTALVEGLAKQILNKEVPNILLNKKILSLDLSLVVAGTMYRGDFENRLKMILDEVKKNKNIILFIDELHNISGAGSASGAMDAANILKPLLARGQLRCIGATTLEEYKKFIEKDAALERRFQPIILSEPTVLETIDILHGVKENYQDYHKVTFTDEAVETAAHLSARYIQDKLLPDKAIDLLDEAAAKRKIAASDNRFYQEIRALEHQLTKIQQHKNQAVLKEEFTLALKIKSREKEVEIKIEKLQKEHDKEASLNPEIIGRNNILEIISQKTHIPLTELLDQERGKIKNLPIDLKDIIIGQDSIIDMVASVISRAKLGLADENRPLASFMFLGPSGVGKTYLAKTLAGLLFHDKESFIRIDMSEFSEKFNATKLVGAPAGYIGYREGNKLTDAVKRRPYSLILLDEIEKAHPDVLNLLLQVLEDGHLTDATGKQINFKNTIIVMTSNIGLHEFNRKASIGFSNDSEQEMLTEKVLEEAKKSFRPEFVNRIDSLLVFKPLEQAKLSKIIELELERVKKRLAAKGLSVEVADKTIASIAKQAASLDHGARGVKKIIFDQIEKPIADGLLNTQEKEFSF